MISCKIFYYQNLFDSLRTAFNNLKVYFIVA